MIAATRAASPGSTMSRGSLVPGASTVATMIVRSRAFG
jgi:hypothetical protein